MSALVFLTKALSSGLPTTARISASERKVALRKELA